MSFLISILAAALLVIQPLACPAESNAQSLEASVSQSNLNHPPAFIDSVPPAYPEIAIKAKLEGTVVVKAVIGETGALLDVRVITGVNPMLNKAAIQAVRSSTFSPSMRGGNPVQDEILVSYPFDLEAFHRDHVCLEKPPIDWTPPLISEVGELIEVFGAGENEYGVYSYSGIKIYGDITLSLFTQALKQVRAVIKEGEEVQSIRHNVAYKPLGELGYMGGNDLEVVTCTRKDSAGNCDKGEIYVFINQGGVYSFDYQENGIRRIWMH